MSRRFTEFTLLTVLGCTVVAASALAQSDAEGTATSGRPGDLEEVIVTAQRRAERLQEVPIAITVQSGEQLRNAGVRNLRDLVVVVPGVRLAGAGANIQPSIRGVQSQQTDPGNDANVAVYVDGVYQANQIANNLDLPDVRQIEVLKGRRARSSGATPRAGQFASSRSNRTSRWPVA